MAIKFDIHSINNAAGEDKQQPFVKLLPEKALTAEEIAQRIERACTVTQSDIVAVLSALSRLAASELSEKGSFHLPAIGYFTLQAVAHPTDAVPTEKLEGSHVGVRNIKFQPERTLLSKVKDQAKFARLKGTTQSMPYEEAELRQKITAYLTSGEGILTSKAMRLHFGLSSYMAAKWLAHFVSTGFLRKLGSKHAPVYVSSSIISKSENKK